MSLCNWRCDDFFWRGNVWCQLPGRGESGTDSELEGITKIGESPALSSSSHPVSPPVNYRPFWPRSWARTTCWGGTVESPSVSGHRLHQLRHIVSWSWYEPLSKPLASQFAIMVHFIYTRNMVICRVYNSHCYNEHWHNASYIILYNLLICFITSIIPCCCRPDGGGRVRGGEEQGGDQRQLHPPHQQQDSRPGQGDRRGHPQRVQHAPDESGADI